MDVKKEKENLVNPFLISNMKNLIQNEKVTKFLNSSKKYFKLPFNSNLEKIFKKQNKFLNSNELTLEADLKSDFKILIENASVTIFYFFYFFFFSFFFFYSYCFLFSSLFFIFSFLF